LVLPKAVGAGLRRQLHDRPGATISVDLASQTLTAPDGTTQRFDVDPFRKQALLKGQDEIALTMEYAREIEAFEARHAKEMPWLSAGAGWAGPRGWGARARAGTGGARGFAPPRGC